MAKEERRSKRTLVLKPIEFSLAPSIIEKTYDGVVTDISDSGACLLTTSHLKDRQRIILLDKSCSFEKAAIVRWSQEYNDIFYKIGLEFLEDQAFMSIKDKRRYKRLNIKNLKIRSKMGFAHYIKIVDISLGGLFIETDKKWNIGEEYTLHVEYEGKQWNIKGYIVRSILKKRTNDNQGNIIPIYSAGMKFTSALNEIQELLKFIELRIKRGGKNEYCSFILAEANIQGQDTKYLKSHTHT
jgi:Tfp pilus assembly protein PilZ